MPEQTPIRKANGLPKSFMTAGPTLHYSHANVHYCWGLALGAFVLSCFFWAEMLTDSFPAFTPALLHLRQFDHLGRFVLGPLSIFEYPWQILVLGLLMGIMAVVPVLVSQLLSFTYSTPFVLAVAFLAGLPGFALCVLLGSLGAACRPLRFRSRFIAVALCMAPQILYWGFLGQARGLEPIKWGFSFAPWVCAWFTALVIAVCVLGIGHFTRYRPGIVWVFTFLTTILALWVFQTKIGLAELAYQRYIAKNDPRQVPELHEHNMTPILDRICLDPQAQRLLRFFYPSELILLRAALKSDVQAQLAYERWPSWFPVTSELNYQAKKRSLSRQYDLFISPPRPWWMPGFVHRSFLAKRAVSERMPIALYYKALLSEYKPDIKNLDEKEVLCFYSDYPHWESLPIWYELYANFGQSGESIEARCRIATLLAGQEKFEKASELITEAQVMARQHLSRLQAANKNADSVLAVFRPPADSTMTVFELTDLALKLAQLQSLLSPENLGQQENLRQRLARFVALNPYSPTYVTQLESLLAEVQADDRDPLRDNLLLAKAKTIPDTQSRSRQLAELAEKFRSTDGGIAALYELGLVKIRCWKERQSQNGQAKSFLVEARQTLSRFTELYPDSFYAEQARSMLDTLPAGE